MAATPAQPLNQFSQCHAAIRQRLRALDDLPALLAPAKQARESARDVARFFSQAVVTHHAEEEQELFPAVLASATPGDEREQVRTLTERLTREHRQIESRWARLAPALDRVAQGRDAALDPEEVQRLVADYHAHADFEEQRFLPLAQQILGRNPNHVAALDLSLHLRHALPEVLSRYGQRL